MRVGTVKRLALALVFLTSSFASVFGDVERASASSIGIGSQGNCNYNHPHGWSWTNWSGYASSATGNVYGELDWRDGNGSWHYNKSGYNAGTGSSRNLSVDNYDSGTWRATTFQEIGVHNGTIFTSQQYSVGNLMWCP